jgi:hypothetical protein
MQDYLLIEKEEKTKLVLAMRLAESAKLRYGAAAALEQISEKIVNLMPAQNVIELIKEIENNNTSAISES